MKPTSQPTTLTKTDRDTAINRIRSEIERSEVVLIVSHLDPDGDALGSQIAMGEYLTSLGKTVLSVRDSDIPDKYEFLPKIDSIVAVDTVGSSSSPDLAIILECPQPSRMGRVQDLITGDTTVVAIDHHRDNAEFGDLNWVEVETSSVGEMIYEYFAAHGWKLTATAALGLYVAIMTDTGRFRFPATSARTMEIAGALIAEGVDPQFPTEEIYYRSSPEALRLHGLVLGTLAPHNGGRFYTLSMSRAMLAATNTVSNQSDGLVDYTLFPNGSVAGALLKEADDGATKVSLRSRGTIDVASIARRFGGGGHFNAAGCRIEQPLEEARVKIVDALIKVTAL